MQPNKENLKKLVAALRSGEYKQCEFTQKKADNEGNVSFCAYGLGVEIWGQEMGFDPFKSDYLPSGKRYYASHSNQDLVLKYYGISLKEGLEIADLNNHVMNFPEMAEYLENKYDLKEPAFLPSAISNDVEETSSSYAKQLLAV